MRQGANVQVAYYDQQREQLDPERTVFDTVGEGNDTVTANGRSRHVNAYLSDFLFPPERAQSPVKSLSGGERNRLLLARLFTRPANVLVLDEPTNDLDLETLELLEAELVNWPGTLLLVSHDRVFLDNVVTSTLVFEGGGRVQEYVGRLRRLDPSARAPWRRSTVEAVAERPWSRRRAGRGRAFGPAATPAGEQEALVQGAAKARRTAGADRCARGRTACGRRRHRRSGVLPDGAGHHHGDARAGRGDRATNWWRCTPAGTQLDSRSK